MRPVKGPTNRMQRLSRFPAAPHVSPLRPRKLQVFPLRHRHHLGRKIYIRWCCIDLLNSPVLSDYCSVTKLKFPEATHIIGLASEAGLPPQRSEDFIYMDASHWTAKDAARAKQIQKQFGFLRKVTREASREYEYPIDHRGKRRGMPSRNSRCPCGSGERFKNCHGQEIFRPKRNRKR